MPDNAAACLCMSFRLANFGKLGPRAVAVDRLPLYHSVTRCQAEQHSSDVNKSFETLLQGTQEAVASRLPRFYVPPLQSAGPGQALTLSAEEGKHAVRSLRLKQGDLVELCDGQGNLLKSSISSVQRGLVTVECLSQTHVPWQGPRWQVAVGCGSLKGNRADWLVEKCTELGAHSLQPLLTDRSHLMGGKVVKGGPAVAGEDESVTGRQARLERVATAATKQSLRAYAMIVQPARRLAEVLSMLAQPDTALAMVAFAGAANMLADSNRQKLASLRDGQQAVLFIGPEGDFTPEELRMITAAGVTPVGLGPHRLRTETAAATMLSAAMLSHASIRES